MNTVITGIVLKGAQRGRELGFPTANLELHDNTITDGIYISSTLIDQSHFQSITFIGAPEMFGETVRRAETYILDFDRDIYGQTITVTLLDKIRESKPFESAEKLTEEMLQDLAITREYFSQERG